MLSDCLIIILMYCILILYILHSKSVQKTKSVCRFCLGLLYLLNFLSVFFGIILWISVFLLRCFNTLQPKPSVTVSNGLQGFVCEELCRFLACCGLCLFLTYRIRVYRYASLLTLLSVSRESAWCHSVWLAEKLHGFKVVVKVKYCEGCRVA